MDLWLSTLLSAADPFLSTIVAFECHSFIRACFCDAWSLCHRLAPNSQPFLVQLLFVVFCAVKLLQFLNEIIVHATQQVCTFVPVKPVDVSFLVMMMLGRVHVESWCRSNGWATLADWEGTTPSYSLRPFYETHISIFYSKFNFILGTSNHLHNVSKNKILFNLE